MEVYYHKTELSDILHISKLISFYRFEFEENYVFPGERHDFWEMVYVEKGIMEAISGKEALRLHEGNVLFHAPNEFHALRSCSSCPVCRIMSFVSSSEAMDYFRKRHILLDDEGRGELMAVFSEAERNFSVISTETVRRAVPRQDSLIGGMQMLRTGIERFLLGILRRSAVNCESLSRQETRLRQVRKIREYIERHIEEKLTMADICRYINYSPSSLCALFREIENDTLLHYINVRKIEQAKKLLHTDEVSIAEIAARLSFDTSQYFARVFRRVTGMTPTAYRQSLRS